MPAETPLGSRLRRDRKLPGPTRERDPTKTAWLLADERCSQAVLVFLATTDVERTSGPPVAEEGDGAAAIVERGRRESGGGGLDG